MKAVSNCHEKSTWNRAIWALGTWTGINLTLRLRICPSYWILGDTTLLKL